MRACLSLLAFIWLQPACGAGVTAGLDCMTEAALLSKEQLDLPRLEVASPKDKPPYCITLETVMAFAGRVKAHVAHCPASNYASAAGEWAQRQADYSKLFSRYRCKRSP